MPRHILPALTHSIRWLLLPIPFLILWAVWLYFQEGSYWSAGLQLLMMALLPWAHRGLSRLPVKVSFDESWLYIDTTTGPQQVPLQAIERLSFTFAQLNRRSIYRLCYITNSHSHTLYVLGGSALQALDEYWHKPTR